MRLTPDTRVTREPRTASRTIDGKVVVIVIDDRKLHTFNEVGSRLWELADGRTLAEMADAIAREFEVADEVALRDAERFIAELTNLRAIQIEEPQ